MSITKKALIELKRLVTDNQNVRVSISAGGCSGLSYKMDFDNIIDSNDEVLTANGLNIVIDKKSSKYLDKVVLDFSDGLQGTGFNFINSEAKRVCGCGQSFSA